MFLGLYMFFVHACEACCEYSNVAFARRVGEGSNLSMVYESIGHNERNMWNQERMSGFVE